MGEWVSNPDIQFVIPDTFINFLEAAQMSKSRGVQQGHDSSVLATEPRQQKLELETVIEAYTYILESHMAPYGANEVELSEV